LLSPLDTGTLRSLMCIACQSFLLPSISIYFGMFNIFLSLQLLGSLDILQGFVSVAEATYLWESNSNVGSPLVLPPPITYIFTHGWCPHQVKQTQWLCSTWTLKNIASLGGSLSRWHNYLMFCHRERLEPCQWDYSWEVGWCVWCDVYLFSSWATVLVVGTWWGTVELFNLANSALPLWTISLFDWGEYLLLFWVSCLASISSWLWVRLQVLDIFSRWTSQLLMLLSNFLLSLWIVDLPYLVHFVHGRWVKENKFSFLLLNLTYMLLISLCSYTVEDTGPINQISWTLDNCAFTVG
jgi:hypothetical protein